MIVRFDNKILQSVVERKAEPIGVEGDVGMNTKGGISEVEKIVGEARKSMGDNMADIGSPERNAVSEAIIREEEDKEPGPELTLPAQAQKTVDDMQERRL